MSIQAGMSRPPALVIRSSMTSIRARATPGAGPATKKATAAKTRKGRRSQMV